jgi:hypothetical protein
MTYKLVSLTGEPLGAGLLFDSAQDAMTFAKANGLKARPEIVIDDSWLRREIARMQSGEYERIPFECHAWFKQAEDNAQRFPHVAKKDPSKIAFTESPDKGMRDIQTVIAPGRYLERFYAEIITAETIRDLARDYVTRLITPEFKIARMSDEIAYVYQRGPDSCMSKSLSAYESDEHPVSVYGLEPGQTLDEIPHALTLAYLEIEDRITARTLINERDKVFLRLYGDADLLRKSLAAAGYQSGLPYNYTIRAIDSDRGDYVMPYIDAGPAASYGAANVKRINDRFMITDGRGDQAGRTDGLLNEPECDEDGNYCEFYQEFSSGDTFSVVVNDRGHCEQWSERAVDNNATRVNGTYYSDELVHQDGHGRNFIMHDDTHHYCDMSNEYWPNEEMQRCEVTDDYFHESEMTEIKTSDRDSVYARNDKIDEISFVCLIDGKRWHNDAAHPDYVGIADSHEPTQDEIDNLGLLPVNHFPHPDQTELNLSQAA